MDQIDLLSALRFGAHVAEDEVDDLENYFVETDQWNRIYGGEVDVLYGAKGSGKSAIYALINRRANDLFDRQILLAPAETPRGATAFSELVTDSPPNEHVFTMLWKLYFVCLVTEKIREYELGGAKRHDLISVLEGAELLPKHFTLYSLLRSVREYIKKIMNRDAESVEHVISYDLSNSIPSLKRKVNFRQPNGDSTTRSIPADDLLHSADEILQQSKYKVWIVIDRLDAAFVESRELERNALRALFRVYNDMRALRNVNLKILCEIIFGGGLRRADLPKPVTSSGRWI